jgi:hypothetical protein
MSKEIYFERGIVSGRETTTEELILLCLNEPPPQGFRYKDYSDRARIEAAMKHVVSASNPHFILEDNDFNNLKKIVNEMKWATRDSFVVRFVEQFQ